MAQVLVRDLKTEVVSRLKARAKRLEIALGTGRSVCDSVYVALAVALECQLVTADERLVNALSVGPLAPHVLWVGRRGEFQ